jgi:antirestriction protein ArdC
MPSPTEIREQITTQVIEAIERGCPPWRRPWSADPNAGVPKNVVSGKSYSGVNPLLLQLAADRNGFTSRWWGTFNQWRELGGQVMRRPEHVAPGTWGTRIVFCRPVTKKLAERRDDAEDETYWVLRTYTAFCLDQVEGTALEYLRAGNAAPDPAEVEQRFEAADLAIAATGADIRYGGDQAYYLPSEDYIRVPRRERFSVPEFYETVAHELIHWSEHPGRLNWDRSKPEHSYALGELIAELGGCYVVGELGLPVEQSLDNHAAYLRHWLCAMREDSRFLFRATAQASKAADFILSFSRAERPANEPELVA